MDTANQEYQELDFGELCVDIINATLRVNLLPGNVRVSSYIHRKIATKHKEHYEHILRYLPGCIARPTYIGKNPEYPDRIELVLNISEANPLLVVVPDTLRGRKYDVITTFGTLSATVSRWVESGWFYEAVKGEPPADPSPDPPSDPPSDPPARQPRRFSSRDGRYEGKA